jgi:ribosome biogenesis GTPase A
MPSFTSVDDFLQKLATLRGKLKKGGTVDVEAAAKIVLHDWNEGTTNKLSLINVNLFPSHLTFCY